MKLSNNHKYITAAALGLAIVIFPQITPILMMALLVVMIALKIDERMPFIFSVVMIAIGAVLLYLGREQPANQFGNYAFYLFIIGFVYSLYNNYFPKSLK